MRAEARMLRWMTGTKLQERQSTDDLRERLGIHSINTIVTRARLRWYGHVSRKEEDNWE